MVNGHKLKKFHGWLQVRSNRSSWDHELNNAVRLADSCTQAIYSVAVGDSLLKIVHRFHAGRRKRVALVNNTMSALCTSPRFREIQVQMQVKPLARNQICHVTQCVWQQIDKRSLPEV